MKSKLKIVPQITLIVLVITMLLNMSLAYTLTLQHGDKSLVMTRSEGSKITLQLKDTYYKAWQVISGEVTITDNKFIMPAKDVVLKAVSTYTISYNANNGDGAPESQTKIHGIDLILSSTVPTRTGYTFLGWSTDSNATEATYSAGATYNLDGDITLYAIWSINSYTISYNANNGEGTLESQTKTHGIDLILSSTVPTRTGYTFLGWSTDSNATEATYSAGATYNLDGDITLYAIWSINSYTLELNGLLDGASSGTINGYGTVDVYINESVVAQGVTDYSVAHPYGSTYEIKNIQATTGHTYNGVVSGSLSGTIGVANVETVLNYTTNSYTVTKTINPADSGTITGAGNAVYATTVILTATPSEGYNFTYWEVVSGGAELSSTTETTTTFPMPASNVEIKANFELKTYTVQYNANNEGEAPESQTKTHGVSLTLRGEEALRTGYFFKYWNTASDGTGTTYYPGGTYTENADVTLYAIWERGYKLNLSYSSSITLTITAESGKVNLNSNKSYYVLPGSKIRITPTPTKMYSYRVTIDGSIKNYAGNTYVFTMPENTVLIVVQ